MRGDGDGWVYCAQGHRHWGRFGAAGLLIIGNQHAVLQHRAEWTHEGGTWALPGGARDSHEDPVATALREASEEAGIEPTVVTPLGWWRDDHGGWSYTTIVAQAHGHISPHAANTESTAIRWWASAEIDRLPLHRGLAGAWPRLRQPPAPLRLVVDAANVVGSRPDGWWHDRLGAARRLRDQLGAVARDGIAAPSLPRDVHVGGLDALLPAVSLVVEGAARPLAGERNGAAWWDAAITTHAAPHDGDASVIGLAHDSVAGGEQALVVSADRALRRRLDPAVQVAGPGWLIGQLPLALCRP
ncbi:MAG TPA: NUDIX hydrolase [Jatrophihabitantaceae bacterium]|jgi:8-oxo-dGTP pyrophosphatase MutT (NUDIX family)